MPTEQTPVPEETLDALLTRQILVAWAGEGGEEPRLAWWRTELASEFGGEDLFKRLLPDTWRWAVLQAVREAARRHDEHLRAKDAEADRLVSLYRLGFELDERLEERFQDLKRTGIDPVQALPGLKELFGEAWSKDAFSRWVDGHGEAKTTTTPSGRRLTGAPPQDLDQLTSNLVAALAPLADTYSFPHYRTKSG